jgi:hypothetical protein
MIPDKVIISDDPVGRGPADGDHRDGSIDSSESGRPNGRPPGADHRPPQSPPTDQERRTRTGSRRIPPHSGPM